MAPHDFHGAIVLIFLLFDTEMLRLLRRNHVTILGLVTQKFCGSLPLSLQIWDFFCLFANLCFWLFADLILFFGLQICVFFIANLSLGGLIHGYVSYQNLRISV